MSDSEYEEERVLAMVELQGIVNSDILYEEKPAKILEPESEHPVLQFGNYIFRGEWEETMGTVVCFEVPSADEKEKDNAYKYAMKTDKKLSLQRIFLEPKPKDIQEPSERHSQATSRIQDSNGTGGSNVAGVSDVGKILVQTHQACQAQEINDVLMDVIAKVDVVAPSAAVSNASLDNISENGQYSGARSIVDLACNSSSAGASPSFMTSASSPLSNGLLSAHRNHGPLLSKDRESASEAEEGSLGSSEADFIILSEIECSNEGSYDVNVSGEAKEPVGSTEGIGSSKVNHFSLRHLGNSSSENGDRSTAEIASEGNSVVGVVNSLLTDVQDMESYDGEASTSQAIPDDVVDSASSLAVSQNRQRQSESSLPLICDSASGERPVFIRHSDDQLEENEKMDVSVADCSDASQISTSGGIGLVAQYPDVFEDEAMDTTENNNEDHLKDVALPSNSEAMYLESNQAHQQSSSETSESYERNEAVCLQAGPSTSSGIIRKRANANSTVNETLKNLNKDACSLGTISNSAEENDSRISHSSAFIISQDYRRSKDSGLIDSTSNKVSCIKRNNENNLRSIPGIDSTTNDSGKKQSVGEEELSEGNNNTSTLNERIDSTMNNMNIAVPIDHVDFEIREATNMTETEDSHLSDSLSIEDREDPPIDSTSNVHRLETYQCETGNVSDSSAVVLHESPRQSHIEGNQNYSSCNVTGSHIDDDNPLSSFIVSSPGNCSSENVQSEVTESSERCIEKMQDVSESIIHNPVNSDVAESSLRDDSRDASSSQVTGSCASTSHEGYDMHSEMETEDDSVNKVTESIHARNYSSGHVGCNASAHEVTDSTNISYPSLPESEDLDESLVVVEDSSVCEVTESSLSCRGDGVLVIDENSSNDCLDSHPDESRRSYSQGQNESPSSAGLASGSDVTESSRFENASFFGVQDHNSSSGDAKEPSSSGLNTLEPQVFEACSSADVMSSAESELFYYSSAASQNMSTNEARMSSASGHWVSPLNLLVRASEYEVSNSSEQNADSTEGDNRLSPNEQDEDPEGSDSSKLPSSTSN